MENFVNRPIIMIFAKVFDKVGHRRLLKGVKKGKFVPQFIIEFQIIDWDMMLNKLHLL